MGLNLSGIERSGLFGRLLRAPLALIPREAIVPILQGPTRGMKWVVGASTHGCWLGSYEYTKRRVMERLLRPTAVVYDVGANVGYYTLLSSALVGPKGRVIAFEPLPRNLDYLRRHIEINRLQNVTVMPTALGERLGVAHFREAADPSMGSLGEDGSLTVQVSSLDDLSARAQIPDADVIKMDIEGGELAALKGAQALLARRRPLVLLATHGIEVHRGCCDLLSALGYQLSSLDGEDLALTDEVMATAGHPS
jgi:FkbM family methyltransferase